MLLIVVAVVAQQESTVNPFVIGGVAALLGGLTVALFRNLSQDRQAAGSRLRLAFDFQAEQIDALQDRVAHLEQKLDETERSCQERLDVAYKRIRELEDGYRGRK